MGGPAVDFVADFLAFLVPNDCVFPFVCSEIAAVAVNGFLFAAEQLCRHGYIVDVSGGGLYGMHYNVLRRH